MNEQNSSHGITVRLITEAAIIAALYVVLSLNPLSFRDLQCRFGEALCMTMFFTPAAAWGMTIGCFLTNLLGGSTWLDTVFGTFATLTACILTLPIASSLKQKCGTFLDIRHSLPLPIPTVIVNALVIPFVLYYGYGINEMWNATSKWAVLGYMAVSIAVGEILSCYVLGLVIVKVMNTVEAKRQQTERK